VPTSCSWLNAVEVFFAKLTRRRLKYGAFHSVVDLQAAINRFIKEHNQQPRPFIEKADPDQIIAAVRRGHQNVGTNPLGGAMFETSAPLATRFQLIFRCGTPRRPGWPKGGNQQAVNSRYGGLDHRRFGERINPVDDSLVADSRLCLDQAIKRPNHYGLNV